MNMKSFLTIMLSVLFLSLTGTSYAQRTKNEKEFVYNGTSKKFGVMITDAMHFKVALETVEYMDVKKNGYTFEIVLVGMVAKEIVEDPTLKPFIDKAEKIGAKLVVCEYALDLFKVDKTKLDKRVTLTPNAWIYMFELKDKGYNTLDIQS